MQTRHEFGIELGNCARLQRDRLLRAIAAVNEQFVIDEVELDLKGFVPVWNGGGGQTPRVHIERHVPPMIDLRGELEPDFPYDLRPHVKIVVSRLPLLERKGWPNFQRRRGIGT